MEENKIIGLGGEIKYFLIDNDGNYIRDKEGRLIEASEEEIKEINKDRIMMLNGRLK